MAPQPPPKKSRRPLQIIGVIIGVLAAFGIGAAVGSAGSDDGKPKAAPTVTVTATPGDTATDDAAADDTSTEDTGEDEDDTLKLTDTAEYENGVTVALSGFTRGVSSSYAAPANTPNVKFTVRIVNGSDKNIDLNELTVNCAYGDQGKSGEQIFDEGLDTPSTHLRVGRSINVPTACELPKTEKYVQIEVSPDFDSESAIFAGKVQ